MRQLPCILVFGRSNSHFVLPMVWSMTVSRVVELWSDATDLPPPPPPSPTYLSKVCWGGHRDGVGTAGATPKVPFSTEISRRILTLTEKWRDQVKWFHTPSHIDIPDNTRADHLADVGRCRCPLLFGHVLASPRHAKPMEDEE